MKKHIASFLLSATIAIASWYCYEGVTASGERFDCSAMTAAHRTLPFGTMVKVKSVRTGKSVVVRINDRGPFITGRHIDLSGAAADALNIKEAGIARVKITILEGSHNR